MAEVKRRIYPPVWMALGFVAIFSLSEWSAGPRFSSPLWQWTGSALVLAGLWLLVNAGHLFRKVGTDMIPFRNVSALVTDGAYRYTRNPMYLGMFLLLVGCCLTTGTVAALPVPLVFAAIIEARFIRPEEAVLRAQFGAEFEAYCSKVRRWL